MLLFFSRLSNSDFYDF